MFSNHVSVPAIVDVFMHLPEVFMERLTVYYRTLSYILSYNVPFFKETFGLVTGCRDSEAAQDQDPKKLSSTIVIFTTCTCAFPTVTYKYVGCEKGVQY